jgi:hypothetical protein
MGHSRVRVADLSAEITPRDETRPAAAPQGEVNLYLLN